ncbi:MAG: beta galactosidase jelly roll domain-containing protein [Sphingomonas sp.]|nr:beta galactosidase jelly roll domain-containing protein [Sphingomonas sp.]
MRHVLAATPLLLAIPASAAPRLDPQFDDHAVIQRGQPILVTGTADPGETLTVALGDEHTTARVGTDGRFAVAFAPREAGGSALTLTVVGTSGTATATDILIGDVFLCSGQSNMELQVSRAQDSWGTVPASGDAMLRVMTIDKTTALQPQTAFAHVPAWKIAGPDSIADFSAACYFTVKTLRQSMHVPIGAIASSWGGTAISAWMGDRALKAGGRAADAALLQLYTHDPAAAARQAGKTWESWWRQQTGVAPGREPWQPATTLDWRPVPTIEAWGRWGVPALVDHQGMVWYRREVTLTAAQARGAATLGIGVADDMDQTWVNGIAVGANGNPGAQRHYPLAAGTLHAGRNVIVVNVDNVYADGGLLGPVDAMKLELADGGTVPIGDGWRYAAAETTPPNVPRVPWDDIAGAGVIYNAMIAPLGTFKFAGVAWYQGETDAGSTGYADRLTAMMSDWRRQFGQPTLPFVVVQLSAYGKPATAPEQSGWAALREEQRQATIRDGHAALAVTIDLGDPLDIHPGEKHEVGRRIARAMATMTYRNPRSPPTPAIAGVGAQPDGGVVLHFTGVTGGLHMRSSDRAIGFELCGAGGKDCRYALGAVTGDDVRLAGDGRPVAEVRYAWADAPVVNLFDASPLPVGPFRIAVPTPDHGLTTAGQPIR